GGRHVEDAGGAVWEVLTLGSRDEIYNIGGSAEQPNVAVVRALLAVLGKPESLIRYVTDRPGHDRRYAMNAEKIARELAWRPRHQFRPGLEETVRWYLEHRRWWERVLSEAYRASNALYLKSDRCGRSSSGPTRSSASCITMSSSERLLILGATGQLGTDLLRAAAAEGVDHVGVGHEDVDVTNADSVMAAMARYRPTIVITTAALHRVDHWEDHPHEAYLVNAVGALLVARAAVHAVARSVYISTDYVFSGDKPPAEDGRLTPKTAWVEDDPARPVNVYGASKAAGEQAARVADPRHLIARVSSMIGAAPPRNKGDNFIEAILKKARAGGPLRVVSDQWITPTYTVDAARAIVRLALSDA